MKHLLTVAFICLLVHHTQAADISLILPEAAEHPAIILIQGPLQPDGYLSDTNAFAMVAEKQKSGAIVFLNGPGGAITTATHIGDRIRERQFKTAVADNTSCVSACALIWIAGAERYMGVNAHLGFHSTRATWDKTKPDYNEPSTRGNAAVIGYLHNVGMTIVDSARLISAPPYSMTWVNPVSLSTYGVSASYFRTSDTDWSWVSQISWSIPNNASEAWMHLIKPPKCFSSGG
jgi:membrane-bound ClpP family serine protease